MFNVTKMIKNHPVGLNHCICASFSLCIPVADGVVQIQAFWRSFTANDSPSMRRNSCMERLR